MADAQQVSGVFSRRKAILTGAGLLAAGAVAGAAGGLVTERLIDGGSLAEGGDNPSKPVMVHLRDAKEGHFDVFVGGDLYPVVDRNFAAKLAQVAAIAA